jgi:hypothetical protein
MLTSVVGSSGTTFNDSLKYITDSLILPAKSKEKEQKKKEKTEQQQRNNTKEHIKEAKSDKRIDLNQWTYSKSTKHHRSPLNQITL